MLGDENNNELFDLANFDAKKTALLVIDELGDPTGTPLEQTLLPAIENTARIAAAARRAGIPRHLHERRPISPVSIASCCSGAITASPATPEAQTSPLLDPKEGDFTIEKRRYSAVFPDGTAPSARRARRRHAHLHGNGHQHLRSPYACRRVLQQLQPYRCRRRDGDVSRREPGGGA